MIWRLARRNLWRNPRRTGIVVLAVAVGISGSLVSMGINYGMIEQIVQTAIETDLGHLQVHAAGWDADPKLERRLDDGAEAAEAAALADPRTRAVARRVYGDGLVSSSRGNAGAQVVGVEADREPDVSSLHASMIDGEWFGEKNGRAVLGARLAKRLKVDVGDKIAVSVQDANGDLTGGGFRVAGLFRTASSDLDRSTVLLRIGEAQELLAMDGAVHALVVMAQDKGQVDALTQDLGSVLGGNVEVRSWEQLRPLLVYMLQSFDSVAWFLYGAVFTAMAFGIANVLLMAVHERAREIGMLRAMGMKRESVVAAVVIESLLVTGVGLIVGMAVAIGAAWWLRDGIDLSAFAEGLAAFGASPRIAPVLRPRDFGLPLVVAGVAATLASLWPALRAAKQSPADALRRG